VPGSSIFAELRRRKVPQAAAIYGAVAWGVTEIVVTVTEQLFLPQWLSTLAVIGFVVGFPVAMFLAWTFDITSEGIHKTAVSSRRGRASIVLSMLLLVAGTAGLFLLIKPALDETEPRDRPADIAANSIAVLPFENAGGNVNDAYLSEGLSDELRDQLSRVPELRIAARSSSVAVLERGMDARAASQNLGVICLVEGRVKRTGSRLQVSVQLIEGHTGYAVWSEAYARGTSELLNVQQAIAEQVVQRVLPEGAQVATSPATRSADANELMLLANYYERQVRARQVIDEEKLLEAIRLYRQATEADPSSAIAHSRLAGALLFQGEHDEAEPYIFRALSLDPNLSEVQNTLGEYYWAKGLPAARTAWQRAVELDPYNADALANYAYLASISLQNAQAGTGTSTAAELYRRALQADPLSLDRHAALGEFLGQFNFADEVPPVIQRIEAIFDDAESFRVVARLYELTGEVDRAIAWTIKARDREPANPDHVAKLADLYALIGDATTALSLEPEPNLAVLSHLRMYDEFIDTAEFMMIDQPGNIEIRYALAFAYVATGAFERAIYVLQSTGLPDTVINDQARTVADIEALTTLTNALISSGLPEAVEIGRSLAEGWNKSESWGDAGWATLFDSCNLALVGRHAEALELLPRIKESPMLRRPAIIRDMYCFKGYQQEPVYLDVLEDQEARRAALRARLPTTLAELGVSL
jgi:TolB-like protein/thioredoxin-like negative regulator of GroEL